MSDGRNALNPAERQALESVKFRLAQRREHQTDQEITAGLCRIDPRFGVVTAHLQRAESLMDLADARDRAGAPLAVQAILLRAAGRSLAAAAAVRQEMEQERDEAEGAGSS